MKPKFLQTLEAQINEVFASLPSPGERAVVRIEVPVEDGDLLGWLERQENPVKIYWSNRENSFETAGLGVAHLVGSKDEISPAALFRELEEILPTADEAVRWYGGMRFSPSLGKTSDALWEKFGAYRFVLPRFEWQRTPEGSVFVCHLVPKSDEKNREAILDELEKISFEDMSEPSAEEIDLTFKAGQSEEEWAAMVRQVLTSITAGKVQKVVLARRVEFHSPGMLSPISLVRRLRERAAACYYFCFQWDGGSAFLGATPERLYLRRGRVIESEAVAGTRPRGKSPEEDVALAEELFASSKEAEEHRLVVAYLEEALSSLCDGQVRRGKRSLIRLRTVQHLVTHFDGELASEFSDADVLTRLHPTPAVCGYPREKARDMIAALEPFDRGWYAAPVGWIGANGAEFAVGIRSGLVSRDRLFLFAGAGIVEGSVPTDEWREVESKLNSFLEAVTG